MSDEDLIHQVGEQPPVIEDDAKKQATKERMARIRAMRGANKRTKADARAVDNTAPAARAEQTREADIGEVLTRRRRSERTTDFDLPTKRKKPGWDYEWKAIRVMREPVDPSDIQAHREAGWRPEKAKDWPELSEPGAASDAPVESYGCRLYGRPMSLTMEARQEDHAIAIQQQRDRMQAAASGKSAIRGEGGLSGVRGVQAVPLGVEIEGVAG